MSGILHVLIAGSPDIIRLDAVSLASVTVAGSAFCSFRINNNGGIYYDQETIPGGGFIKSYDWVLPNAAASLYECRWVTQSNDPTTVPSTSGTWISCGTTRTWTNTVSGSADTSLFTCELRLASNPGVTLKSVTIQLNPDGSP